MGKQNFGNFWKTIFYAFSLFKVRAGGFPVRKTSIVVSLSLFFIFVLYFQKLTFYTPSNKIEEGLYLDHSLSLFHTNTHTHTFFLSFSLSIIFSLSLTLSLILSLSHTRTHFLSISQLK
jgi:hypothetical protein